MSERNVTHAMFTVERVYDAAPARVFRAFADPEQKKRWFGGPSEWERGPSSFDFRVGGRETASNGPKGGEMHSFDAVYWDIVPNERIIYSYDLLLGDRRISVSLATIEFKAADGGKTRLVFTEQGAFLDGYDDAGSREHGTGWLLDKLGETLKD